MVKNELHTELEQEDDQDDEPDHRKGQVDSNRKLFLDIGAKEGPAV